MTDWRELRPDAWPCCGYPVMIDRQSSDGKRTYRTTGHDARCPFSYHHIGRYRDEETCEPADRI